MPVGNARELGLKKLIIYAWKYLNIHSKNGFHRLPLRWEIDYIRMEKRVGGSKSITAGREEKRIYLADWLL